MPANLPPPPPDWAEVRRRYETTDDRVDDICADAGITRKDLAAGARRERWRRQFPRRLVPSGRRPAAPPPAEATTARARRIAPASRDAPGSSHSVAPSVTRFAAGASLVAPPVARTATGASPAAASSSDEPVGTKAAPTLGPQAQAASAAFDEIWPALLARLVAAASLKLEQLEHRMSKDLAAEKAGKQTTSTSDHEREARAIHALTDTLEKFTEIASDLDTRANGGHAAPDADEADRRRRELADRIRKLVDVAAEKP